jgi:hypothetical protein
VERKDTIQIFETSSTKTKANCLLCVLELGCNVAVWGVEFGFCCVWGEL